MSNYQWLDAKTHSLFITLITAERRPILIKHAELLRFSINKIKLSHPFKIKGYVILPDHCHLIIQLPKGETNFYQRINLIKRQFLSYRYPILTVREQKRREKNIWQSDAWQYVIRNDLDYLKHLNYIHYNPIKHGVVTDLIRWKYSSFHYYVSKGFYEPTWGKYLNNSHFEMDVGE